MLAELFTEVVKYRAHKNWIMKTKSEQDELQAIDCLYALWKRGFTIK
jgi:hypothetical protein